MKILLIVVVIILTIIQVFKSNNLNKQDFVINKKEIQRLKELKLKVL